MCSKTLIYGAEYFLVPAPKITKQIFVKINPLERRIPKMLQKSQIFQILNFRCYTPHLLNGLGKFKVKLSKNPCFITMAIVQ